MKEIIERFALDGCHGGDEAAGTQMWAMGRCGKRARVKNEEAEVGKKRKMEETGVFMGERVDGLRIHLVTPAITMYVTIMSICIEVEEKTMILNPM